MMVKVIYSGKQKIQTSADKLDWEEGTVHEVSQERADRLVRSGTFSILKEGDKFVLDKEAKMRGSKNANSTR